MADSKLSALPTATSVDWLYGEIGGASKKIAPASISGLTLISSGKITTPVTSLILALSGTYSYYDIALEGLDGVSGINPANSIFGGLEVSVDGGVTFIGTGTDAFDEYVTPQMFASDAIGGPISNAQFLTAVDLGVDLCSLAPATVTLLAGSLSGMIRVFPGNSTQSFSCISRFQNYTNSPKIGIFLADGFINKAATHFSSSWIARITDVCFQFYDTNWNDSSITKGSWALYGGAL